MQECAQRQRLCNWQLRDFIVVGISGLIQGCYAQDPHWAVVGTSGGVWEQEEFVFVLSHFPVIYGLWVLGLSEWKCLCSY